LLEKQFIFVPFLIYFSLIFNLFFYLKVELSHCRRITPTFSKVNGGIVKSLKLEFKMKDI